MSSSVEPSEDLQRENADLRARLGEIQSQLDLLTASEALAPRRAPSDDDQSLRDRLEELETIYRQAPLGLCVLDLDSRFRRINQKLAEINGLPPEAHIGRTIREILPWLADQADEIIREVLQTGKAKRFELRGQTSAQPGVDRIWDEDWYPLRNGAEITGIGVIVCEVTEHKQALEALRESEETFRVMFNISSVGKAEVDIHSRRLLRVNPALCAMTGYTKSQLLAFTEDQLTHAEDRERDRELFRRLLSGEAAEYTVEKRYLRKDGSVIWAITSGNLVRDARGNPLRMTVVIYDITERKRMEDKLREADRNKDDFIAFLSHELRNPLAPIRSAVELLRLKDSPDPEVVMCREVIDRQVTQISRLLEDLLDINRIARDKLQLKKEDVELQTIVNMAVETARPLIESRSQQLILELAPAPIIICVDMGRMEQVLANLLNNAAKYSDRGATILLKTALIAADVSPEAGATHWVVLSVKDQGIGIANDQLSIIFDPFAQVQSNLGKSQGGLGIGLALAKRLVEMHGGTIDAKSEGPDRGSEFTIRVPVSLQSGAAMFLRDEKMSPGNLRILVVDDIQLNADTLGRLLEFVGHKVLTAYSGKEALEKAEEFRPQVILMDIGMADMDGYETARRMRQQFADRRFTMVAVTGWGQAEHQRLAVQAGFDAHLSKPVKLEDLDRIFAEINNVGQAIDR